NTTTFGINFAPIRDEFIACWFHAVGEVLTRDDLCLEIGGFGAPAVFVRRIEGGWHANFRIPPGTPQGWNEVRLRLKNSRFGNALRIAVDVPVAAESIRVTGVRDADSWAEGRTS